MKGEQYKSFARGMLIPLSAIDDPFFASLKMGDGFGIDIYDGHIFAPADAVVSFIFPTAHALGLKLDDGREFLLHFGLDTIKLQGQGFKMHVQEKQRVYQSQLILEVDLDYLRSRQKITTCLMVFTTKDTIELFDTYQEVSEHSDHLFKFEDS